MVALPPGCPGSTPTVLFHKKKICIEIIFSSTDLHIPQRELHFILLSYTFFTFPADW